MSSCRNFESNLTQSSCMIAKAVQFNADEVKDCKGKIIEQEMCNEHLCKENKEIKETIRVQERYKMRWCLKIKGLTEKKDENIRSDVIKLFNKIAPGMEELQLKEAVDIVHRVGRKGDNRKRHKFLGFFISNFYSCFDIV